MNKLPFVVNFGASLYSVRHLCQNIKATQKVINLNNFEHSYDSVTSFCFIFDFKLI